MSSTRVSSSSLFSSEDLKFELKKHSTDLFKYIDRQISQKPLDSSLDKGNAKLASLSSICQRLFLVSVEIQQKLKTAEDSLKPWQKWVQRHAKETGILALIARLVLWIFPSLARCLEDIEALEAYVQDIQKIRKKLLSEIQPSDSSPTPANNKSEQHDEIVQESQVVPPANSHAEHVLKHLSEDGMALKLYSEYQDNKFFVLAAVKQNGRALANASSRLKNDEEVVIAAVEQLSDALAYAPEEMRNNKNVVMAAVKKRGASLVLASKELKNDIDVVLEAVKRHGKVLKAASESLRDDRRVVSEAVSQDGLALEFASERLKNMPSIVSKAVGQNGMALEFASDDLRANRSIVLKAVKDKGSALKYAKGDLQDDFEVVKEAISQDPGALLFASQRLRENSAIKKMVIFSNEEASKKSHRR